jgi:DNA-binding transcriptional LysR family regulator
MYLLPAIDRFRREFPHVSVTVNRMLASHIPQELMLRTFELGVISFRPDPVQFRTIAVYGDSLAFVVSPSHPLAGAARVSIKDLGEELFVAHNVTSPLRQKVIEAFQRYRTPPEHADRNCRRLRQSNGLWPWVMGWRWFHT